jgi:flavodoxin
MKSLVIYDSMYGNTEKIAQAIGKILQTRGDTRVVSVKEANPDLLKGIDLLLVGSPTQAFNPLPAVKNFLKSLPKGSLAGIKVAAFDTRMDVKKVDNKILTFMAGISGYAAEKIGKALVNKSGNPLVNPEGFIVEGSEGPIRDGELRRAEEWAGKLISI